MGAFEERPSVNTSIPQPRFLHNTQELVSELITSKPVEYVHDLKSIYDDFRKASWEFFQLYTSPVYYGYDVPRGNGESLIYLGGLFSLEAHYSPAVKFFRRIGVDAKTFPWGINIKPVKERAKELLPFIRQEAKDSGRKVKVMGHSFGGYGWAATFAQYPYEFVEYVDHVIFDASPRPTRVNTAFATAYLLTRLPWRFREDDFEISDKIDLLTEAEDAGYIKVTSIVSSHDPIVEGVPLGKVEDRFVIDKASHSFLGTNRDSLSIAAYRLAGQEPEIGPNSRIHHLSLVA